MKLKSPEKEELIFQTVLDIVWEKGLAGLKISDIAKEAGLAHGTVYIYFKNKKDLINQLYQKAKRSASKNILDSDIFEGEFRMALEKVWRRYLSYLIHNQRDIHFMKQCLDSSVLEKQSLKLSDDFQKELSAFLKKGKESKQLKSVHDELILSVLTGLAKEIVEKINTKTLKFSDELMEDSFELCWNAIRK